MAHLARLSLVKSLLNESGTSFDNDLKLVIESVSEFVESYCRRELESQTFSNEYYTGDGSHELWLDNYPVTSVTSVAIWDGDDSYDTESSDYYELIDDRYLYYPKLGEEDNATWANWYSGIPNNIKVTYVAGYDTSDWDTAALTDSFGVPADLEMAVAKLAVLSFKDSRKDHALLGVSAKSYGVESITVDTFEKGIPDDVLNVLNSYRRILV